MSVFGSIKDAIFGRPAAQSSPAPSTRPNAPRERASEEDDCKIFCLLGRELLGWGETPPDISQFAVFYRPEGNGYVEQCPWKRLGVTPLPPGKQNTDNMRFFTQPRYENAGATAIVSFVTYLVTHDERADPQPPYVRQQDLTLAKANGRWEITARSPGPVT